MSISESRLAYIDCFAAMDKAIDDEAGARVPMESMDAATFYRMRCHQARKIDRRRNREIYEEGHLMYGLSIYDKLVIRIRNVNDRIYVYFTKVADESNEAESLSEVEEGNVAP
jgi:hypothetical protein